MRVDSLVDQARTAFQNLFDVPATVAAVSPGRVNLIGEHVDYNEGLVLPLAIDRHLVGCAAPSPDHLCHIFSSHAPRQEVTIDLSAPILPGEPFWANYVRGVVAGFLERGVELQPFSASFTGDLPIGAGLSASAALEVVTATLLEGLSGIRLEKEDKAFLAQQAEHDFAGVPCGIMDPFILTFAKASRLLLLDCRTHEMTFIPFPSEDLAIVVTNSGVQHRLADTEYAQRRRDCETAALYYGVDSLRDLTWTELELKRSRVPETLVRRARHVITEIDRVTNCANRLAAGEWTAVASLLYASHESLRDDYEVSCPELDLLVELSRAPEFEGQVYGSRMTGAGFGGSTVSLVARERVEMFQRVISARYLEATGIEPETFVTSPVAGAHLCKLGPAPART